MRRCAANADADEDSWVEEWVRGRVAVGEKWEAKSSSSSSTIRICAFLCFRFIKSGGYFILIFGIAKVKLAPSPGMLSAYMIPLWCSSIFLQIANPIPDPG